MKKRVLLLVTLALTMVMSLGMCVTVLADADAPEVKPCSQEADGLVYVTQNDEDGFFGWLYDRDGKLAEVCSDSRQAQDLKEAHFDCNPEVGHVYHMIDGIYSECNDNPYSHSIGRVSFYFGLPEATVGDSIEGYLEKVHPSVYEGDNRIEVEGFIYNDCEGNNLAEGKFESDKDYYMVLTLDSTLTYADTLAVPQGWTAEKIGELWKVYNDITVDEASSEKSCDSDSKSKSEKDSDEKKESAEEKKSVEEKKESDGGDTYKSSVPAKTVLSSSSIPNQSYDFKVHPTDERSTTNQSFLARVLVGPTAQILLTESIYPGRDLSITENGSLQTLTWGNLPKNQAGPASAVVYNQIDGAYVINGILDANGTATFTGFKLRPASTITICK